MLEKLLGFSHMQKQNIFFNEIFFFEFFVFEILEET
jgi:hypothetical protein